MEDYYGPRESRLPAGYADNWNSEYEEVYGNRRQQMRPSGINLQSEFSRKPQPRPTIQVEEGKHF